MRARASMLRARSSRDMRGGMLVPVIHHAPDPTGAMMGKALRDARAERVGDDVEPIDPERRQQVIERICVSRQLGVSARRLSLSRYPGAFHAISRKRSARPAS